jgi:hypothetical protein
VQEDREMDLDGFKFKFGDEPKKDDLTIFVPRQDDPTDTVSPTVDPRFTSSLV